MDFIKQFKRVVNTGQSRSIILTGNLYDLFEVEKENWVPLIPFLSTRCNVAPTEKTKGIIQLIYRLNNPVEIRGDRAELDAAWQTISGTTLEERLEATNENPTYALELLRQLTEAMRRHKNRKNNLLIIIESADMLLPEAEINRLLITERRRIAIVHDWFSEPAFLHGGDTVLLLAESRSTLHSRISRLPQVLSIEVGLPDLEARERYICQTLRINNTEIGSQTAGLSIHALRQLIVSGKPNPEEIAGKVEEYMISQLGDGVIEFKRPTQKLQDVIGFRKLKEFMAKELIPSFKEGTISGAAVGGPIGGGKTFLCEAVAAELGIPVITLKNIRSKWYGETDQIFERLRRLLETFHRIVIFVDEADTQFGSVGDGEQATERRLTGKIQAMMSDVALKGKVIWFLMTARIHLLSPDIRRPGRMDLIIPVLDPEGEDRKEFIRWALGPGDYGDNCVAGLSEITKGWSAATFAILRSQMKKCKVLKDVFEFTKELLPPNIGLTRRYQTLQALLNCTRRSLIPSEHLLQGETVEKAKERWQQEIQKLESLGVR